MRRSVVGWLTVLGLAACSKGRILPVPGVVVQDVGEPDLGAELDAGVLDGAPDQGEAPDTGEIDASPPDSGPQDMGDLGPIDTGPDAGPVDMGPIDMGPPDMGPPDMGVQAPIGMVASSLGLGCPVSAVPTTRCTSVVVSGCAGADDLGGLLKISDPAVPLVGTVVLGSDGRGTSFYETAYGSEAVTRIIMPLLQQGFRVVQRRWSMPGWTDGPGGAQQLACRYATLADWLYTNEYSQGGFCATGNGQGASEIGYALAQYGQGAILDLALLTNGPVHSRIDFGCLGANEANWAVRCPQLTICPATSCEYTSTVAATIDRSYGGMLDTCQTQEPSMSATWMADSIMSSGATLSYPQTELIFLSGSQDCTAAVPLGRLYAAMVGNATERTVNGVPHAAPGHPQGAEQIFQDLRASCILRH